MTMTAKRQRIREENIAKQVGPRVVGGIYESGYWGKRYRVDAIEVHDMVPDDTYPSVWFEVTWFDEPGRDESTHKGRHCTPWDKRDKVVSQP